MIKGIGIDLIELDRIKNSMDKNKRFIDRILTKNEREVFSILQTDRRKIEFLAGRFAAKEAFAKATGTGIGKLSFQDIEIMNNSTGAPVVKNEEYEAYTCFVSISHSRDYAVAQVIIEE